MFFIFYVLFSIFYFLTLPDELFSVNVFLKVFFNLQSTVLDSELIMDTY